ncbi:MAG: L-seryl-tRNA(Sec) selenium transferase [Desulfobacterales bacterium]|nr:L-seryl-tRNA(Sec) selenium transferase [Desulfobacterales bacterium]
MDKSDKNNKLLQKLPSVGSLLESANSDTFYNDVPKSVILNAIHTVIDELRSRILENDSTVTENNLSGSNLLKTIKALAIMDMQPNLLPVVNATGVVVHTNLGRSILPEVVIDNLAQIAGRYSNLEFNLAIGQRGSRYESVEGLLCELTGAESAMVVNNNAGAVLLCLETMAKGRKVIVSRGELVEIGGSFRVPDIMTKSGAILKEVGTTNRTHIHDYQNVIDDETGLFLKVHTSNYSIVGFTAEVSVSELAALGSRHHIPVMEDLGSGTLIDFSKYGLHKEPTVQESVASGADIITFSGDKLLGGPQAGIIVGNRTVIARIRQNPMTRALRIDKLTLAALEATLRLYRNPEKAVNAIPTLRMITASIDDISKQANRLKRSLTRKCNNRLELSLLNLSSRTGGGSFPLLEMPSKCIAISISGFSTNEIEETMRANSPPIIGRIEEDKFILDPRTIQDDDIPVIVKAFENMLQKGGS